MGSSDAACAPPKNDEPLLHRAARLGDVAAIRDLVRAGADVNAPYDLTVDPDAWEAPATPLMVAAGSGDGATVETVRALLSLGADPRVVTRAGSAACFACRGLGWGYAPGGDVQRLRVLLEAGSPLPKGAEARNQLLCDTAGTGDAERVRLLLEYGFDPRGYFDPAAAEEQQTKIGCLLGSSSMPDVLAGAPEEIADSVRRTIDDLTADTARRMASAPSAWSIPLFRAAESGSEEAVRVLLRAGADPAVRDSAGQTAMYAAASAAVVRALMEAGVPLRDADAYGWSPLTKAVLDGKEALPRIRALIEAGADVNETHDRGYTVFMSAVGATGRDPEVLRLLIEAGADPHAVSELGFNAFHAAIDVDFEANAEESVRATLGYLRELGVDIEHRNARGQTPLARAIQEGTGLEVRVLCELGANPEAVCPMHTCGADSCGSVDLPLLFHAAIGIGVHSDVKTEALLRAGASPLVEDADGYTPLVRLVAALCRDAEDYDGAFRVFFEELRGVRLGDGPVPANREAFVSRAAEVMRDFTQRFARDIPVRRTSAFAQQWREEQIRCIAWLGAYQWWWGRREAAGR
jgi:ankyrin repeat protein